MTTRTNIRKPSSTARRVPPVTRPGPSWPLDVKEALKRAEHIPGPLTGPFFDPARPVSVARAPGRLDVLGGIGDYSGSRVLEWPISEAAVAVAQASKDLLVVVRSLDLRQRGVAGADEEVRLDVSALAPFASYAEFRSRLPEKPEARWGAYVLGALAVLVKERGARFDSGIRVLLDSQVPPGKGVASSAAIEVAVLLAVAAAHGVRLKPHAVPALAQKVENEVVGAPCGIMDQIAAYHAAPSALLPIDCRPGSPLQPIPLPEGLEVVGIDSGVRHDVKGDTYRAIRTGTAMGYRIITDLLRLKVKPLGHGHVKVEDPVMGGYLANLGPDRFEREFSEKLPVRVRGSHFLDCFAGITDPLVTVEPKKEYQVRAPASHPIHEHLRVKLFAGLLQGRQNLDRELSEALGELMLASNGSYTRCGLSHPSSDLLVDLAMAQGPERGIYGARASGGGSGGTVVVLLDRRGRKALARIAEVYGKESGKPPLIVRGSSRGAQHFTAERVLWR